MWRRLLLTLLALAMVLPVGSASGADADEDCAAADDIPTLDTLAPARRATLCLLNEARAAEGVPIVHTREPLRLSARRHARNMMHDDFFSHETPGGQTVGDRVRESGYLDGAVDWDLGEVLGWGERAKATPREAVRRWLDSPDHRSIVLDPIFEHAGIGVAFGAPKELEEGSVAATYAVTFARRR